MSSPAPPPIPSFLALLRETGRMLRSWWAGLLLIAVTFALLLAAVDISYVMTASAVRSRFLSTGFPDIPLPRRFATLAGGGSGDFVRGQMLRSTLLSAPFTLLSLLAAWLLCLAGAVCMAGFLRRGGAWRAAGSDLPSHFLPAIKLSLLFAAQSFLWVPVLGVILGRFLYAPYGDLLAALTMTGLVTFLALGPRYVLGLPLLLRGKSPLRSLRESEEHTRGVRWVIVTDFSAVILGLLAAFAGVSMILGVFLSLPLPLLALLEALAAQGALAFFIAFLLAFSDAVLAASPLPASERAGSLHDFAEGGGLEGSAADEAAVHA